MVDERGDTTYERCCRRWRHKLAMASPPVSSGDIGGVASTSSPRLTNSPFLMWNSTSALVAANVMSLSVNQAGLGSRWIRCARG